MNSILHKNTNKAKGTRPSKNKSSSVLIRSPYQIDDGNLIGANPLQLSKETILGLDLPRTPLKAIRANCIECSGGSESEARKCIIITCALWPLRMGRNVYHANAGVNND